MCGADEPPRGSDILNVKLNLADSQMTLGAIETVTGGCLPSVSHDGVCVKVEEYVSDDEL